MEPEQNSITNNVIMKSPSKKLLLRSFGINPVTTEFE